MMECYMTAVALFLYEDGVLNLQGGESIHDFHKKVGRKKKVR